MERQFQGNVQLHLSLPDGRKVPIPLVGDTLQTATDKALRNAHAHLLATEAKVAETEAILTASLGLTIGNHRNGSHILAAPRKCSVAKDLMLNTTKNNILHLPKNCEVIRAVMTSWKIFVPIQSTGLKSENTLTKVFRIYASVICMISPYLPRV